MHVPTEWLSTDRLSLRPPTEADAASMLRILADPSVAEHHPSELVVDLAEVRSLVERWLVHWSEHGFGNCCVFEKDTGRLVGNCGLRWRVLGDRSVLNLMYRFDPSVWGHGYASEAAGAVVEWARRNAPDEVVLARIRPLNLASQRVALKAGLGRDPELDGPGEDGAEWAFTGV